LHNPISDCGDSQSKLHMSAMSCWAGLRSSILFTRFAAKGSLY
jgi:hypothetical protein